MKRVVTGLLAGISTLLVIAACGSSGQNGFDEESSSGTSGTSGASGTSGDGTSSGTTGSLGTSGASGTSGTSGTSGDGACGAETVAAKQSPVDILVMLDASGSMMEQTGNGSGPTKWAEVKSALNAFIADPKSAGLGVGLQIFPIKHPGAPASCTSNAQCTVGGASLGRCFLKACTPATANDPLKSCDSNADCGAAQCRQLGECRASIISFGSCLVGDPVYGTCTLGTCQAVTSSTCDGIECVAADYATPKVSVAALPGNAAALSSAINAIPDPPPEALTPTSVAVSSGVAIAKAHAAANPGHSVFLVLATDGFPTRCAPLDIPGIASLAAAGVSGTPSVKTFVIGVFKDADKATATANLDTIAAGGGTTKAFIVTTGSSVATEFQKALDAIRGSALPCEYSIPKNPGGGDPDFGKVNVQHTSGAGAKNVLGYKANLAACAGGAGWYYDKDPATGAVPTKIILCPNTCDTVKKDTGSGKVEILLGCKTIVK